MSQGRLENYLLEVWYGRRSGHWLRPLGVLYAGLMRLRAWLYARGIRRSRVVAAPVIVVGNLTAGGTGKTPLVLWLVQRLCERGAHPGIISRGYGGNAGRGEAVLVSTASDVSCVGDEALMMARRAAVPVAVCRDRHRAAQCVLAAGADVIVCDDGLQHLALARDIEVVVVDGVRRFGNGRCLPAGPLRETVARLASVDAVIVNGCGEDDDLTMSVTATEAVRLSDAERRPLSRFARAGAHAVAAIGNPQRFFSSLREFGIEFDERMLSDHANIRPGDIRFDDDKPVLITEKDAVKCDDLDIAGLWYVPVDVQPDASTERVLQKLVERCIGTTKQ